MQLPTSRTPILLGTLALSACGVTDLERDTEAPIQTDRLAYVLREATDEPTLRATIPYRYENRTAASICMTHCGGAFAVALEKRITDEWVWVWSPPLPDCRTRPPITIEPRGAFRDTLRVTHVTREDAGPKIKALDFEGAYRMVIPAASRLSSPGECGGEQVPEQQRISNRFVLKY